MTKPLGNNSLRAVFAVLIAACLFGTSASARALIDVTADSIAIAFVRLSIGAVGLLIVSLFFVNRRTILQLFRSPYVWFMAVGVAGYQYFFFVGTDVAGIALGTLVSLALAPFFAGLLAWIWKGVKPQTLWYTSTLLAVCGLACLSFYALNTSIPLAGVAASFVASIAYATYTVIGTQESKSTSPLALLAVSFLLASFFLLPFSITRLSFLLTPEGLNLSLWLGLVATTIAYAFFAYGLPRLQAGVIATLNLAEPVVASILGVVVIGEQLGALALLGCALILLALTQLALSHR